MKFVIYSRYSSDLQSDASIEDQIRICRERADKEGWTIKDCYSDHAISGASMLLRPAVQQLVQDAGEGKFEAVMAESLERLSRDLEDIAGLYKRLTFNGVKLFTLSEGWISEIHIGLKGTMGQLYLKDLADKTRRGLRGRVEAGKSGGGISFGYDMYRKFDANGEAVAGDRKINEEEAAIVRRVFADYLAGKSPKAL